jgi:hypothetical protein
VGAPFSNAESTMHTRYPPGTGVWVSARVEGEGEGALAIGVVAASVPVGGDVGGIGERPAGCLVLGMLVRVGGDLPHRGVLVEHEQRATEAGRVGHGTCAS